MCDILSQIDGKCCVTNIVHKNIRKKKSCAQIGGPMITFVISQ